MSNYTAWFLPINGSWGRIRRIAGGGIGIWVPPTANDEQPNLIISEADAALISAAPDLLAALRAFIEIDANFSKDLQWARSIVAEGGKSARLAAVVILAREAIAKASGGAP